MLQGILHTILVSTMMRSTSFWNKNYFIGKYEGSREKFIRASMNTRRTWNCNKFAIGLLFLYINLEEVLDIRGFHFLMFKRENKVKPFKQPYI